MNNEEMSDIFGKLNGMIDKDKISPDMVNNFISMLGNNSNNTSTSNSSNSSEEEYISSSSQSNTANHSNASSQSNTSGSSSTGGIDMETLLKMQSIFGQINSKGDDPRSNLLQSLKPYLKESRRDKVDQYAQLMNMSKMMNFLPFMGGGNKKDG